jgi:hypothetical protein
MAKNMMRQGDLLIVSAATLPKDAVRRENRVLAEGEATGHAHRLDEECEVYENNGVLYFKVNDGKAAVLSHEEHGALTFTPGTYKVVRQREYTPAEWKKKWRNVSD